MELSKQSYDSITTMPVKRMYDYIKWKADIEEQKAKMIQESANMGKPKVR